MRYFYISKDRIENNNEIYIYDVFDFEFPIEKYKTSDGKEDAILYIGENIPNDWEYIRETSEIVSISSKVTPYHYYDKTINKWVLRDEENYKTWLSEKMREFSTQISFIGFEFNGNNQKVREKDFTLLASIITSLSFSSQEHITWYYSDTVYENLNRNQLHQLLVHMSIFKQAIEDIKYSYTTLNEVTEAINIENFYEKVKNKYKSKIAKQEVS